MADATKLLRSLLGKAYRIPETEIDTLLDDQTTDEDGAKILSEKDKVRIIDLKKSTNGKSYDDGIKKGKAEAVAEFETSLKESFGIETEATGPELITAIVAEKNKTNKGKDITEDDVKKHPAYQTAEKAFKAQLKQTQTEWEQKLANTEMQFKKAETFTKVRDRALTKLKEMNPVIPSNPKVAATIEKTFLDSLKDYDFDFQPNGIVVMKDGKVVDDGHGHSLEFEKLVTENAANYFEFKANNGGGNAGNGGAGNNGAAGTQGAGGKTYPAGITKPTNWEELNKIVNDQSIKADDRQVVLDTFVAENPGK